MAGPTVGDGGGKGCASKRFCSNTQKHTDWRKRTWVHGKIWRANVWRLSFIVKIVFCHLGYFFGGCRPRSVSPIFIQRLHSLCSFGGLIAYIFHCMCNEWLCSVMQMICKLHEVGSRRGWEPILPLTRWKISMASSKLVLFAVHCCSTSCGGEVIPPRKDNALMRSFA